VDLSGLIFVALAVAWATYLIPKALRHHEDVVRGRSVDRFSQSMRVLARREPVSARSARLVVTPSRDAAATTRSPEEQYAAQRAAAHRATKRRRRVLALLALAIAATVGAGIDHRLGWPFAAIPVGLLVAWLVACRLMVRRERSWRPVDASLDADLTGEIARVEAAAPDATAGSTAEPRDPTLWDPVPTTLPTYVSKPPARRSVRTIDLDSTGVWTSGRSEVDSALAREAEAAERVRRRASRKDDPGERAVSS
jgi:hypothetical protein